MRREEIVGSGGSRVSWCQELINKGDITGVKSLSESASVAEAAASTKSCHLLPATAASLAPGGSAEKAFLPSMLNLLAKSLDVFFSCFGLLLFCVIEDFRGLLTLSRFTDSFLCSGGSVEERPGGERAIMEGSRSRGLGE